MKTTKGKCVLFVANPSIAPGNGNHSYAKPDDHDAEHGKSWRNLLELYNKQPGNNPLNLLPACQLYGNAIYGMLVDKFGIKNVYILSAGWGLIPANFLTPKYDITFPSNASGGNKYIHRGKNDHYDDFSLLPKNQMDDLVFFGGKNYQSLFCQLTQDYRGKRFIYYKSKSKLAPNIHGIKMILYHTNRRTNWHYECAKAFIRGAISL